MKSKALPKLTKELLGKIRTQDLPEGTYLGGGTAVALWLGHRRSVDLDWFTPVEYNEQMWQQRWETELDFSLTSKDWQTLDGYIGRVKMALYYYKYPLIGTAGEYNGLKIAGLEDLAAMKLDTVSSRGTKRDFVDLFYMAKRFGLQKLFDYYDLKYGQSEERELSLKKALVYFDEADGDEMPDMVEPVEWEKVKDYFRKIVLG